ncbi:g5505 [Coccomyxa elongata]
MATHDLTSGQNGHRRDLDGDLFITEVLPALPPAPHLRSAQECALYLRSLPGGPACLREAEELAKWIKASHPINEEFHHWAADSIVTARSHLEEKVVASCCQGHLLTNWEGHSRNIPTAVESVLVSGIHRSTLQSLEIACTKDDASLHELTVSVANMTCCQSRYNESRGRLGKELADFCSISSHFLGKDLAPAAATLQHMEQTCCCPLEVAECVEDSIHLLVEAAALPSDWGGESHVPDMTADDVLGLMIATVILAQPHCMVSMLEYVKAFHTSGDWAGQTGFQVATLEAAIAFLPQQATAQGIPTAAGSRMARNSSMSLLWALLDSDEPLTFVQNAAPLQTALRKAAQSIAGAQTGRQLKHLHSRSSFNKYGDAPALRTMLSDELTERAASLHRSASLQHRHSRGSASSGASVNGDSLDAAETGRPARSNGGSSSRGPSSVYSPGHAPGLQHRDESTDPVGNGFGGFPGFHPMSTPFRSAAWGADLSPQHSMQPNEDQHRGGTTQEPEASNRPAKLASGAQNCAAGNSGSSGHRAGVRAQEKREKSENSDVTRDEGFTGFRGDNDTFQGRRGKSDQLAAALMRMSMRADEQLRDQAERILKSSG